jgi:hypothetical protein
MADTLDVLKSLGTSVARGVPQLATGFVDLAGLPLTMTGLRQPEQIFGSTAYLTNKGLLPQPQTGLLNQGTELASSMLSPAGLAKAGLLGAYAASKAPKYSSLLGKSDIEQSATNRLITQYPELKQQYNTLNVPHAETKGGRILNTDAARELFPEYAANRTLSAQVHEPASTFVKNLYAEKLSQPTPAGLENTVVFTAGGTGAGKTSAIKRASQEASDAINNAEMIYDTNMNTFKSADDKIKQALDAGRNVQIFYTYRDPVTSLTEGALTRASKMEKNFGSGRTVPLSEHLKTHIGSQKTIKELAAKYKDNDNVIIRAIDNSKGVEDVKYMDINKIPKFNETELRKKLNEALEKSKSNISEAIYKGTKDY